LALHRAGHAFDVVAMVTMFDESGARSRSHGLRPDVLAAQAACLGLDLVTGRGSWQTYEAGYQAALAEVGRHDITHVIFGDIAGETNREFPERVCQAAGLVAVEPLWGEPTPDLFREFVATGAEARMVTVRDGRLDAGWLGRRLTLDLLPEFVALDIDACGEYGEYHTVVLNGPLFARPLDVTFGQRVQRADCWAVDVEVA
jgi:uncharacterized protein (TIGR00290 family)